MNERIRELAEQASKEVFPINSIAFMEKFAELIVRECMSIAKQVENEKFEVAGSAEPEYRKGINDGRRNAAWGIKNRMKLHFGVEE
jgi:hypothetical protein